MIYADYEQMILRFDERTLKDLVLDDGTAETNLSGNLRMQTALQDASAEIDAACQVGKMYSQQDLAELVETPGTDRSLLRRICCELALVHLIEARPEKFKGQYKSLQERTEGYLDRFRNGTRVFNIESNKNAGVVHDDGFDHFEYSEQNWIPDRMSGFYPSRVQRLPLGR